MALTLFELSQFIEQYASLGIFVTATGLTLLSVLAWRRERDQRMAIVAVGYAMFAIYGLVGFLEYVLLSTVSYQVLELAEHGSEILVLVGLVAFFVALTRD